MNTKKKLVSLGLAVGLTLSTLALPAGAETAARITYTDVPASAWYYQPVDAVTNDYGVMNGVGNGKFAPGDTLTREQFVKVLFELSGESIYSYKYYYNVRSVFSDVERGSWYEPYVTWAYVKGVTNGVGDGKFGVNQPVTREQMAQFMKNYFDMIGLDPALDTTVFDFVDAGSVSDWAREAVTWSHQVGIFNGDDERKFNPASGTSRAEAAQVFYNFLANIHNYEATDHKETTFTVTEFTDYMAELLEVESSDASYYYKLYQETGDKTCLKKRDVILAQQVAAKETSYGTCLPTLSLSAIEDGLETLDAVNAIRAEAGLDPYSTNLYVILAATLNVDASYHYFQNTGTFTHTMPCRTDGEILALYSSNTGAVKNWYSERSYIVEAVKTAAESEGVDISAYDLNDDNTLYSLAFGKDCAGNNTKGTIPYLSSAKWTGTTGHYEWLLDSSDSYTAGAAYVGNMTGVDFSSSWGGADCRYTTDEIRELIAFLYATDPSKQPSTTYTCTICGDTYTE